jgi:hypothetical protein
MIDGVGVGMIVSVGVEVKVGDSVGEKAIDGTTYVGEGVYVKVLVGDNVGVFVVVFTQGSGA